MKTILAAVLLACVLTGTSSPRVHAQQSRSAADGVYTAAQAKRGEAVYQNACAMCHGPMLAGNLGPPLAGQAFLGIWNKQTLADLFDKIHSTMPADAPGTLTREQSADLVAYILQANTFPAGRADLGAADAGLKQIALALSTAAASPAAAAPTMSFPAVGNMNQVMRGILFPSSNILFDVQLQDPSARPKPGVNAEASLSVRYGSVYDAWTLVDVAAIALAESGPMLMTPGRRCENGQPVPVDRADWQKYVQGLVEVGRAAYRASQTRKQEAVAEITDQVAEACANCHRAFRDRRAGPMRCTAP
jgi:mono/diheme cytochrome c family protein